MKRFYQKSMIPVLSGFDPIPNAPPLGRKNKNSSFRFKCKSLMTFVGINMLLLCFGNWAQAQTIYLGNDSAAPPACNCLNNATTLTNGQFEDVITVEAPTGQIWTVTAATNAYDETTLPPPAAPISLSLGTTMTETATGVYKLNVKFIDASPYTVSVSNGLGSTLQIGNNCFYPNVQIVGLPDTVCQTSLPVPLQSNTGGITGIGTFFIDGIPAISFNAQTLGVGVYEVSYVFDAGSGTPNDPSDPGCITTISRMVEVPLQPTTAVNTAINVTLGNDCTALIGPDLMLEGTYPCIDDFVVTVFDQFGFPIGNTVTGEHAGFTLNVQLESLAGGFIGNGQITIFDVEAPDIICPPDINMVNVPNQVQFLNGVVLNSSPTFIPNNFACYNPTVEPLSGNHFYELDTFYVTQTDVYTIELLMNVPDGGVFGLYQNNFNPFGGPCQNISGVSEPQTPMEGYYTGFSDVTRLHVMLTPGMPYVLLTTAYGGNSGGAFEYAIHSVGSGLVVGAPSISASMILPLYCSSVEGLEDNPASLDVLGTPVIIDNCMLNPSFTFEDVVFDPPGFCGTSTITRTFTVTDQSGNSNTCQQTVEFPPISIEEVNYPPGSIIIPCDVSFETNDQGNPHPSETGFPFVMTADGYFNVDQHYCNILATYTDLPQVMVCEGTYQFIRQWVVFDDCDASDLIEYDQVITIGDLVAPVLTCSAPDLNQDGSPDVLIYATNGDVCEATFSAPLPTVTDDCSGFVVTTELVTDIQIPITNPFGVIIGFQTQTVVLAVIPPGADRTLTNVPVGEHRLRYTATDNCGNIGGIECPIRVQDFAIPTAVCDDLLHISIGGNGLGTVFAIDVDEGSSDNCGEVTLQVRRTIGFDVNTCLPQLPTTTSWDDQVNLYCCELADTVTVELLVTDEGGLTNTCSTEVVVMDNTAPSCIPPAPIITTCNQLPPSFDMANIIVLQDLFGAATATDLCGTPTLQELAPTVSMGDCGQGTILRRFIVTDQAGNTNTCQQLVTINSSTNYEIKFPKDVIGECNDPGADTVIVNNYGCDVMAITSNDQIFDVSAGACYKVLRTYTVINWCEYDGFSPAVEVPRNANCGETGGLNDVWVLRRANQTFVDADNDETNGNPAMGLRGTQCDGLSNPPGYWLNLLSNGYWSYTQIIKVFDNTAPTISVTEPPVFCSQDNESCSGDISINFSLTDGCATDDPTVVADVSMNSTGIFSTSITLTGLYPNFTATGAYPIGSHQLRIQVEDACGNTDEEIVAFEIADCAATGLICNGNLTVGLMPQPPGTDADGDGDVDLAAAAVNVNLLVNSAGEDCSGPLQFTLHRISDLATGVDVPFPNHPALVVTCDEAGTFVPVRIYLWDNAFNPYAVQPDGTIGGPNYTTCNALLSVQDNQNICTSVTAGLGNVSGLIITESGEPVAGVEVAPRDDLMDEMLMTESDGLFDFNLETDDNYLIQPYSPNDYSNGVSTLDIALAAKHVLGIQLLNSPYKIIAADVNHSNTVTTLDLVHMRKLVLGLITEFPNNESWRFISTAFDFPDPTNPWLEAFPEAYQIPSLLGNMSGVDFIGVKVGDVNGNAIANLGSAPDDRYIGDAYYLRTDEIEMQAGQIVEAAFNAADEYDEVMGFQFTLQFDPQLLAFEDIEWGQIQAKHLNLSQVDQGMIAVSWTPEGEEEGLSQTELSFMTIRFMAQQDGRLSEAIGLTSRLIRAEAYSLSEDTRSIGLNFAPPTTSNDEFFLEQNRPNPFGDQTIIGFQIPEGGLVTLTIIDTHGKTVRTYQQYFSEGYNQFLVSASDITARGLLYYKLETDRYAATKKMVILTE